jgi:hypothetical protein
MPFDWKYNVKKIAESIPKPEVSMDVDDSSLIEKFQGPVDAAVEKGKSLIANLGYSAVTDKSAQDVDAAQMGAEVAKSFGAGETGQSFAALLAQYGPSVMSMVSPGPKAGATVMKPDTGFGKIILTGVKESGFKQAKESAQQAAANLAKEFPNEAARNLAKEAIKTSNPEKIKQFIGQYPELGRKLSSALYAKKAAQEVIKAKKP